jgi:hypothetical protein
MSSMYYLSNPKIYLYHSSPPWLEENFGCPGIFYNRDRIIVSLSLSHGLIRCSVFDKGQEGMYMQVLGFRILEKKQPEVIRTWNQISTGRLYFFLQRGIGGSRQ